MTPREVLLKAAALVERGAARAFADDAEVEIVSIDGGPDMVRRVS